MWRACVLGLVVAAAAAAAADIHAAVGADSPIMIREALEAGASMDTIGPGGQTPLMAAVLQGKVLASHPTQPDPHPTATNRHPRRAHVRTLPHAPGSPPSHPSRCMPSGGCPPIHTCPGARGRGAAGILCVHLSTYPGCPPIHTSPGARCRGCPPIHPSASLQVHSTGCPPIHPSTPTQVHAVEALLVS